MAVALEQGANTGERQGDDGETAYGKRAGPEPGKMLRAVSCDGVESS